MSGSRRTWARVAVLSGPLSGLRLDVGDRFSIGRHPDNTLRLPDEQVSRFHALIEREGEHFVLVDKNSRTGVTVNGRPLRGRAKLSDGAELVLGQTKLCFLAPPGDAAPVRAAVPSEAIESMITEPGDPRPTEPEKSARIITLATGTGSLAGLLVKDSVEELRRTGQHLEALIGANSAIARELDLARLFEKVLDQILLVVPAHRAVIFTRAEASAGSPLARTPDPGAAPLRVRAARVGGSPVDPAQVDATLVSHTIVRRAFQDKLGILTLDAGADARFDVKRSIVDQNIRSVLCVPMVLHDVVLGVIYLDTVGIAAAFKEEDLRLLTGIAGPAAAAVKNAMLVQSLKSTAADTIFRLSVAAEYRDDDTGFHIHRMSDYAETLARALGHGEEFAETVRLAAPMHDVGKIGIPDAILKKPGRLTREEFEEMKAHTVKGAKILADADSELLRMAENIALTHHEKFDGSGYPRGLAGKQIPLEGRIVAVADVFDAVTSRRCYKPAFALDEALAILRRGRGVHFDPEVVDAFFDQEERILAIREHYATLASVPE